MNTTNFVNAFVIVFFGMANISFSQRPSLSNLMTQLEMLSTDVNSLQTQVDELETTNAELLNQIAELESQLQESRVITTVKTGFNQVEFNPPSGFLFSRRMTFEKQRSNSRLRITYEDGLRSTNSTPAPSNEVEIWLDESPTNIAKLEVMPSGVVGGNIRRDVLTGIVDGVSKGIHQIDIRVTKNGGSYNLGEQASYIVMVEEIPPNGE